MTEGHNRSHKLFSLKRHWEKVIHVWYFLFCPRVMWHFHPWLWRRYHQHFIHFSPSFYEFSTDVVEFCTMINSGNILTYPGINILVLKLIVLTLPMDFFPPVYCITFPSMALELPSLKFHVVFSFIMEGVSGKKTFIFRVQCIAVPFVGFQACAIISNFMFQLFCTKLASGIL